MKILNSQDVVLQGFPGLHLGLQHFTSIFGVCQSKSSHIFVICRGFHLWKADEVKALMMEKEV